RITPCFLGVAMQGGNGGARLLAGRIGERHPAVAPFRTAPQRHVGVTAIPQRDLAPGRERVDAGILDRVPLALEADVRLGPERPHDLDLLFRAAAAVVEILVEADKLDLVPPDPDAEPEPPARQDIETGGLFGDEHGLAL